MKSDGEFKFLEFFIPAAGHGTVWELWGKRRELSEILRIEFCDPRIMIASERADNLAYSFCVLCINNLPPSNDDDWVERCFEEEGGVENEGNPNPSMGKLTITSSSQTLLVPVPNLFLFVRCCPTNS